MTDTELNEAVARKLGYELKAPNHWRYPDPTCDGRGPLPDFCHSIAAAWEIPGIESLIKIEDGRWSARFGEGTSMSNYYEVGIYEDDISSAIADTAPMAICMAFLKLEDKNESI